MIWPLSLIFGSDDEEEDKEWLDVIVHLKEERRQETARIEYADGTEEKVVYDTYSVRNGIREYKYIEEVNGVVGGIHGPYFRLSPKYEQEKEVVMRNVKNVEILWEEPLVMRDDLKKRLTREKYEELKDNYDIEIVDGDGDD